MLVVANEGHQYKKYNKDQKLYLSLNPCNLGIIFELNVNFDDSEYHI